VYKSEGALFGAIWGGQLVEWDYVSVLLLDKNANFLVYSFNGRGNLGIFGHKSWRCVGYL